MSASTNLIGDIKLVIAAGPSDDTKAKAIAEGGPIMDYPGNCVSVEVGLTEASVNLLSILQVTDGSDPSKAGITAVQHALVGGGAPSGTLISDLKTAYATGPSAASKALAIAEGGPIMDYPGMVSGVIHKLSDAWELATEIVKATDSGDSTSLGHLHDIITALS